MRSILKKVVNTITAYHMATGGDHIVVAVSGGPDSVCLLAVLDELSADLGISLAVAHFDHGLRPGEDAAETRFVWDLVDRLRLPCNVEKAGDRLRHGDGSLEERARHARYAFLEKIRKEVSAHRIAMGHTLNDQAETVLMRLLRGSGTAGLAGIPPCRDQRIIRPMIEVTREEILTYLRKKGLPWMTDASNAQTRFLRNRIRLEVMPLLSNIQPKILKRLGQTARLMQREDAWMNEAADQWIDRFGTQTGNREVGFPLASFRGIPEALQYRIVRQCLKKAADTLRRIDHAHIRAVVSLAHSDNPHGRVDLPHHIVARRRYDWLVFGRQKERDVFDDALSLAGPGIFVSDHLACTVTLQVLDRRDLPGGFNGPDTAFLDADQITLPLVLRKMRPGDRFVPLGMTGHRKLKDFFIDLKIPLEERDRIPVLAHEDKPIWVCGYRIDERYKVTDQTRRVFKVTVSRPKPHGCLFYREGG